MSSYSSDCLPRAALIGSRLLLPIVVLLPSIALAENRVIQTVPGRFSRMEQPALQSQAIRAQPNVRNVIQQQQPSARQFQTPDAGLQIGKGAELQINKSTELQINKTAELPFAKGIDTSIAIPDRQLDTFVRAPAGTEPSQQVGMAMRSDTSRLSTMGNLSVTQGGLSALVVPGIGNSGLIQANLGKAQLNRGNVTTVDFYGDQMIQLAVDDKTIGRMTDARGTSLGTYVSKGANDVVITAGTAKAALDNVVNLQSSDQATGFRKIGDKIVLSGAIKSQAVPVKTPVDIKLIGANKRAIDDVVASLQGRTPQLPDGMSFRSYQPPAPHGGFNPLGDGCKTCIPMPIGGSNVGGGSVPLPSIIPPSGNDAQSPSANGAGKNGGHIGDVDVAPGSGVPDSPTSNGAQSGQVAHVDGGVTTKGSDSGWSVDAGTAQSADLGRGSATTGTADDPFAKKPRPDTKARAATPHADQQYFKQSVPDYLKTKEARRRAAAEQ